MLTRIKKLASDFGSLVFGVGFLLIPALITLAIILLADLLGIGGGGSGAGSPTDIYPEQCWDAHGPYYC